MSRRRPAHPDFAAFEILEYVLLDGEIFHTLSEAKVLIEQWRRHYNTVRPRSSLGWRPPAPERIVPVDRRPTMH